MAKEGSQLQEILDAASAEARAAAESFKQRAAANALPGVKPPAVSDAHMAKFAREALADRQEALLAAATAAVMDSLTVKAR